MIGAGSTVFARNLLGDILSFPELSRSTIALMDIDPERLHTSQIVAHKLEESLIDRVIGLVEHHKRRIKPELFVPRVDWRRGGKGGAFKTPSVRRRRVAVAPSTARV